MSMEKLKEAEILKIKNIISMLLKSDLKQSIDDINKLDGWIRVTSSLPKVGELVLITNGVDTWMGGVELNRFNKKEWGVVYDGAPRVMSHEIKAWQYFPILPTQI